WKNVVSGLINIMDLAVNSEAGESFRELLLFASYLRNLALLRAPGKFENVWLPLTFRFLFDESLTHVGYVYFLRAFTGIVEKQTKWSLDWLTIDEISL
ncbi:MAG: hypothetical protein ACLUPK_04560, partial [Veillonella sp.]